MSSTQSSNCSNSFGCTATDQQDGSSNIIQHLKFLLEDTKAIKDKFSQLDRIDDHVETQAHSLEEMARRMERMEIVIKHRSTNTAKGRPTRLHRQRTKAVAQRDLSTLLDLPEAVQKNIMMFVNDITIQETSLPDKLIENDCLTEDECSIVASKPSRKDQVRHLVQIVRKKGPQIIQMFLDLLDEYPQIQKAVEKSLEDIRAQKREKEICFVCLVKKTVDYKDIADMLWSEKLIQDNLYDRLTQQDVGYDKSQMWSFVLKSLSKCENHEWAFEVLRKSLEPKYPDIVKNLNGRTIQTLQCECKGRLKRSALHGRRPLCDSQTDVSTTSDIPYFNKILGTTYGDDTDSSLSSSLDSTWSRPKPAFYPRSQPIPVHQMEDTHGFFRTANSEGSLAENLNRGRQRHISEPFQHDSMNNTDPSHQTSTYVLLDQKLSVGQSEANATSRGDDTPGVDHNADPQSLLSDSIAPSSDSGIQANAGSFEKGMYSSDSSPTTEHPNQTNEPIPTETDEDQDLTSKRQRFRRRTAVRVNSADQSDDDRYSVERHHGHRARRKPRRLNSARRQLSEPGTCVVLTSSRQFSHAGEKVGTRPEHQPKVPRKGKGKVKKEGEEAFNLNQNLEQRLSDPKMPYNPMWGKVLQQKRKPKWDYRQARRYSLMARKMYPDQEISRSNYTSDPAGLAEDSDATLAYTEQTV